MAFNTARDKDCPRCLEAGTEPPGRTAYIALLPYATGEGENLHIVEPHRHSLCRDCYLVQRAQVYPDEAPLDLPLMPTRRGTRAVVGTAVPTEAAAAEE